MQRLFANNLWVFPSSATFLVGFIAEPIATLYAPFKIACQIIGGQPRVGGFMAEQLTLVLIAGIGYDFARYADISINIMIAVFKIMIAVLILATFLGDDVDCVCGV